jgi:hypothetical protein
MRDSIKPDLILIREITYIVRCSQRIRESSSEEVLCKLSLQNDAKQVGKVPKVVVEAKERIDPRLGCDTRTLT